MNGIVDRIQNQILGPGSRAAYQVENQIGHLAINHVWFSMEKQFDNNVKLVLREARWWTWEEINFSMNKP